MNSGIKYISTPDLMDPKTSPSTTEDVIDLEIPPSREDYSNIEDVDVPAMYPGEIINVNSEE